MIFVRLVEMAITENNTRLLRGNENERINLNCLEEVLINKSKMRTQEWYESIERLRKVKVISSEQKIATLLEKTRAESVVNFWQQDKSQLKEYSKKNIDEIKEIKKGKEEEKRKLKEMLSEAILQLNNALGFDLVLEHFLQIHKKWETYLRLKKDFLDFLHKLTKQQNLTIVNLINLHNLLLSSHVN